MRNVLLLAGLAAVGLGLGMGCGGVSAHTVEVREHERFETAKVNHRWHEWWRSNDQDWEETADEPPHDGDVGDGVGSELPGDGDSNDSAPDPVAVSSVPEPDVWALMIVAMAFLGLCARSRIKREKASRA